MHPNQSTQGVNYCRSLARTVSLDFKNRGGGDWNSEFYSCSCSLSYGASKQWSFQQEVTRSCFSCMSDLDRKLHGGDDRVSGYPKITDDERKRVALSGTSFQCEDQTRQALHANWLFLLLQITSDSRLMLRSPVRQQIVRKEARSALLSIFCPTCWSGRKAPDRCPAGSFPGSASIVNDMHQRIGNCVV